MFFTSHALSFSARCAAGLIFGSVSLGCSSKEPGHGPVQAVGAAGSGASGSVGSAGAGSGTYGAAAGSAGQGSAAAGVAGADSASEPGWHNVVVGGGGFIDGVVFHPAEAGLVYLRTDIGGAYRFDATHARWQPITDGLGRTEADSLGILSLAIDPSDKERVYLMAGKYTASWAGTGVVLASKDRGQTWTKAPLTVKVGGNEDGRGTGERLQVDPNLGSHLFMGTTKDGLWQSTDFAATWTKVTSFTPTNVNFVIFDGASGPKASATAHLFAAVASTTAPLWESVDAGANWKAVPGAPAGTMAIRAALAGKSLYVTFADVSGPNGATSGSLQRLDTTTLAWSSASPPTGSYGFGGVSIDAKNAQHVVVSTLDRWAPHDELYESVDGAKTFKPLLETATFDRSFAPYTSASTPHWLNDVEQDPFDSSHALFVTGYGLWSCTGLGGTQVQCAFQNAGIEETVAAQVIAPPTGAPLLSAMGDIDGFKHDRLNVSPPSRYTPQVGTTLAIAFAEVAPMKMVKAFNVAPFGASSGDGGVTWQKFATFPSGATAGGTQSIALSADGSHIVWSPTGAAPSYSSDQGASWKTSTGLSTGLSAIADRVNPNKFYALDALAGRVLLSSDGGASFTAGAMGLATLPDYLLSDGTLSAVFGHEGHLWLTLGTHGLLRSTDSGATFSPVTGPAEAFSSGFGKAKAGAAYPALYVWATVNGSTGVFRSDDEGKTFSEVTDAAHKFGTIHCVTGDPNVYGRVFLGTEGRGIQYFTM
ncbi:MAG: endoglucanase [Pseudomonadota bacterium]